MFGQLLKEARKKAKMSQDELAERIGVNRVAISNYEQGKNTPTLANLNKIKTALKLSADYFDKKNGQATPTLRPLIGAASCGVPVTYYYEDMEMIEAPANSGKNSYYVRADGDSMIPDIRMGALVLCDPDQNIESGHIVHFEWDGQHGIKRYIEQNGVRMMVAINTAYPPIIITDQYELRMVRCVKVTSDL